MESTTLVKAIQEEISHVVLRRYFLRELDTRVFPITSEGTAQTVSQRSSYTKITNDPA